MKPRFFLLGIRHKTPFEHVPALRLGQSNGAPTRGLMEHKVLGSKPRAPHTQGKRFSPHKDPVLYPIR